MNVNAKIQEQKDRQGQKDKDRDKDILYHRMPDCGASEGLETSFWRMHALVQLPPTTPFH